jgi:hypothetical protein
MTIPKIFNDSTKLVIDQLEGGYFNPAWHNVGDPRYSNSGETMYGLDRLRGNQEATATGKQFWSLIDKNKTKEVWKWNYKGGALGDQLKNLAVQIMYPLYSSYAKLYLNDKAKKIVDNDPALLFHFVYATWNGSGWFKKFATDINTAVNNGVTNLQQVAINSRTKEGLKAGSKPNSLIAQGGEKIKKIFETLIKNKPTNTTLILIISVIAGYFLYKKFKA